MRYQNAPLENVHNTSRARPSANYPRRAALVGMLLSVCSAFALSAGCKSYSTCEDTKTCRPGDGDGDGDGDAQGGMGGMGESGNTEQVSCTDSEIECDGACIDPDTDINFCGATGSCRGASSGETCETDEICVDGECQLDCAAGLVLCDDTCIDPLTNNTYCGAGEGCSAAVNCGETLECVGGECFGWSEVDTVDFGDHTLADARSFIDDNGQILALMRRTSPTVTRYVDSANLFAESMQWTTPSHRNAPGAAQVSSMDFAVNSSGKGVLVWLEAYDNFSPAQLWTATRNPNGTWGTAEPAIGQQEGHLYTLSVSLDEEGNAFVAWQQEHPDLLRIWTIHRLAGEQEWSSPESVSVDVTHSYVGEPRLTPMPEGEALLVFDVGFYDATPSSQVFASVSTGGTFPEAKRLAGELASAPLRAQGVASDRQGRAIVVGRIHESPSSPRQVWIATLHEGEWFGPTPLIDGELPTWVDSEQVVLDGAGRAAVLWRELRPTQQNPSGYHHVRLYGYDVDEGAEVEIPDVPTTENLQLAEPRLQTDGLGNLRVTWWEYPVEQPYPRSLKTARYRDDAGSWSGPTTIGEVSESVSFASFGLNASGLGILTWIEGDTANDTLGFSYFGPQTPVD
jgi:hypothetical protein